MAFHRLAVASIIVVFWALVNQCPVLADVSPTGRQPAAGMLLSCNRHRCPSNQECVLSADGSPHCICPFSCKGTVRHIVCGSDGRTYLNPCLLRETACIKQKEISIVWNGHCHHRPPAVTVGSHGSTTSSVTRASVPSQGTESATAEPITENRSLSSGTRGTVSTDLSIAAVTGESPTRQGATPCSTKACAREHECRILENEPVCVPCPRNCSKSRDTICGSDGSTYKNPCILKQKACIKGVLIIPVHEGRCQYNRQGSQPAKDCSEYHCPKSKKCAMKGGRPVCTCERSCSASYEPVCGTDGNFYFNKCLLRMEACQQSRKIRVTNNGTCAVPGKGQCEPPCGKDRICVFRHGHPECVCSIKCIYQSQPVCGSNGQTYWSECQLRMEACQTNTHITVKHDGQCINASPCSIVQCPKDQTCQVVDGKAKCLGDAELSCAWCEQSRKGLITAFQKACRANLVMVGRFCDITTASGETLADFTVEKILKKSEGTPTLLRKSKVRVQLRGVNRCNCSLPQPHKLAVLAGSWSGGQSLSEGYLETTGSDAFFMTYQKKPWKLWRGFYRFSDDLRILVCGNHNQQ